MRGLDTIISNGTNYDKRHKYHCTGIRSLPILARIKMTDYASSFMIFFKNHLAATALIALSLAVHYGWWRYSSWLTRSGDSGCCCSSHPS